MTTRRLFWSDNAQTTLAAGITNASPSLQVVSGGGALFPAIATLGTGAAFLITLFKNGSPNITEVMLVTGRAGDNFTGLVRNFSGTGALAWNAGDTVAIVPTAEALNSLVQAIDLQGQWTNYALDTGAANNYVVTLALPLNAHFPGMPIRWKAAHANTGASNFNDSIGAAALLTANGQALVAGDIVAGGLYETWWDGTQFRVIALQRTAFSQLSGSIANGQVPAAAVLQWQTFLAISTTQLYNQILSAQIQANLALAGAPSAPTAAVGTANTQLATTGFVNPGSSFGGASNYRREPDGSITQWGLCNPNGGAITVTFPVAFPSGCRSLSFGQVSAGPTQSYATAVASTTGFTVANTGGQTYWQAKGN
jgi:hypothetical protein